MTCGTCEEGRLRRARTDHPFADTAAGQPKLSHAVPHSRDNSTTYENVFDHIVCEFWMFKRARVKDESQGKRIRSVSYAHAMTPARTATYDDVKWKASGAQPPNRMSG